MKFKTNSVSFEENLQREAEQLPEKDREAYISLMRAAAPAQPETLDEEYVREYTKASDAMRQKMDAVGPDGVKAVLQARHDFNHLLQHLEDLSDDIVQEWLVWKRGYEIGERSYRDIAAFELGKRMLALFDHTREILELPDVETD